MVSENAKLGILFYGLLLLFFACSQKAPDVLSEQDYLLPVLADLYYMQLAVEQAPESIRDSLATIYKEQIFRIHSIDEEELQRIQRLLTDDTEKTATLYDSLFNYMEETENRYLDRKPDEAEEFGQ